MNIGQFRRNATDDYLTPTTFTVVDVETEVEIVGGDEGFAFIDKALHIAGGLTAKQSYYLKTDFYCNPTSEIQLEIYLKNSRLETDNMQYIGSHIIKLGPDNAISPFEIVLTPNNYYDYIVFKIVRTLEDYQQEARQVKIQEASIEFYSIINLLTTVIQPNILKKIGVQAPSGTLMSINGEQIRVGKSGIYEIMEEIDINSIGFVVKDDSSYFILDYQY